MLNIFKIITTIIIIISVITADYRQIYIYIYIKGDLTN